MLVRFLIPFCGVIVCACSSNKNAHAHFDPCEEMVKEADGIRDVEKQLAKNDTRIKHAKSENDTAKLNSELRMRDALREKKKYAQFSADKMRADCNPSFYQEPPPVDRTQYREQRQQGK